MTMLELSHISKTFNPGTINEKTALRDVSLSLKEGEFSTLLETADGEEQVDRFLKAMEEKGE